MRAKLICAGFNNLLLVSIEVVTAEAEVSERLAMTQEVHRHHPAAEREYRCEQIVVRWYPELCIHVANCLRQLPGVFGARARPWVDVNGASADDIAATITGCPSGALQFERLDGGPQEKGNAPTRVHIEPDGPYHLRGDLLLEDPALGDVVSTRATLCRCGASENKPYCDMSHKVIRFKTSS